MSKILKKSIETKLNNLKVSVATKRAFDKEVNNIINSKYNILDRLTTLKNNISQETKTMSAVKKVLVSQRKEVRQTKKNIIETEKQTLQLHSSKVTIGFQGKARKALELALKQIKGIREVKQLGVYYKKKDLVGIKADKRMTRPEIQELGNNLSKLMKRNKINGSIGIAVRFDNMWAGSKFVNYGHDVKLYTKADSDSYDDQKYYQSIEIFFSEEPLAYGGASPVNDCLFKCLWYYLHDSLAWKSDYQMKKSLGVKPLEKVGIDKMPMLETKLNVSINVTGDYIYQSSLNKPKVINLLLLNEHYQVDYKLVDSKVKRISNNSRMPVIYDPKTLECFNGEELYKLESTNDIYDLNSSYIYIRADDKDSLETQYNQFIEDANILFQETKGMIDLYKTGDNDKTAMNLFDRLTHHIKTPTIIGQSEALWMESCKQGALIYATEDNYIGEIWKYDVKSMYPNIMSSGMLFPIDEGEFKQLAVNEFENLPFYQYGIYRCIVSGKDRLFKFNKNNYYTHIDLNEAKRRNLKIDLIVDNQPNFLYYARNKLITGKELFKQYVDTLYDLKERKVLKSRRVKQILNILWGKLSEVRVKRYNKRDDSDDITTLPDNCMIHSILPYNGGVSVSIVKNDKRYVSPFARIAPFLLSKGREQISKIITPYEDIVVRCHTDGIMCRKEPIGIKTGNKLGELAFEEYIEKVHIQNCNQIKVLL